jgi:phosphoglycolate phosphatase
MGIIFDLDGTLIDSKKEIQKTYLSVFEEIRPNAFPDVSALNYSLTLQNLLKSVYCGKDEEVKIGYAHRLFAEIYDTSGYEETSLYDGVIETLSILAERGYKMYVATNKRLLPTMRILRAKKMSDFFPIVMANEMQPGITLSKREMIHGIKAKTGMHGGHMVGDAVSDIEAGRLEQLITVAAKYGYESEDRLLKINPDHSIDTFRELLYICN